MPSKLGIALYFTDLKRCRNICFKRKFIGPSKKALLVGVFHYWVCCFSPLLLGKPPFFFSS